MAVMKAKEREMKRKRKQNARYLILEDQTSFLSNANGVSQSRIQAIKDKRAAKEEKERFEKMAEKMHMKRVERLKRREKRNKLLKS